MQGLTRRGLTRREELEDWICFYGFVGLLVAVLASTLGAWIANIVKLVAIAGDPVSVMFALRALGVPLFPLGIFLGYL